MKTINKILILFAIISFIAVGCTKDFEETNISPNSPLKVPAFSLMTNAQKQLMDNMRNEWWGGRFGFLLDQQISQNNYTSEDRYAFREGTNNDYWTRIYGVLLDLKEVIRLNTDPTTKADNSKFGDNNNQIAAARILKAWVYQNLTDIYGDIPYSQALDALNAPTPKYDNQKDIYADLIKELTEASAQIDNTKPVFTSGDVIYGGDAVLWQKFANSLKLRVALRMSKVAGSNYMTYINEAINAESGVFTDNTDNARFTYLDVSPVQAPIYRAYYVSRRTDFAVTKQFTDLLHGFNPIPTSGRDNSNPFFGIEDPRLYVFADKTINSPDTLPKWTGMPYGMSDNQTVLYNRKNASYPGIWFRAADYSAIFMDCAEVKFILSEVNGFDQTYYEAGIRASMSYYGIEDSIITAYIAAIPAANAENVATQKYIALYFQAHQPWLEYRRTGYPKTLVRPGEVTYIKPDLTEIIFTPLVSSGTDLPKRMTFPQQEQTINATNWSAAKTRMGGDVLTTKVWVDGGN